MENTMDKQPTPIVMHLDVEEVIKEINDWITLGRGKCSQENPYHNHFPDLLFHYFVNGFRSSELITKFGVDFKMTKKARKIAKIWFDAFDR